MTATPLGSAAIARLRASNVAAAERGQEWLLLTDDQHVAAVLEPATILALLDQLNAATSRAEAAELERDAMVEGLLQLPVTFGGCAPRDMPLQVRREWDQHWSHARQVREDAERERDTAIGMARAYEARAEKAEGAKALADALARAVLADSVSSIKKQKHANRIHDALDAYLLFTTGKESLGVAFPNLGPRQEPRP